MLSYCIATLLVFLIVWLLSISLLPESIKGTEIRREKKEETGETRWEGEKKGKASNIFNSFMNKHPRKKMSNSRSERSQEFERRL